MDRHENRRCGAVGGSPMVHRGSRPGVQTGRAPDKEQEKEQQEEEKIGHSAAPARKVTRAVFPPPGWLSPTTDKIDFAS